MWIERTVPSITNSWTRLSYPKCASHAVRQYSTELVQVNLAKIAVGRIHVLPKIQIPIYALWPCLSTKNLKIVFQYQTIVTGFY